LNVGNIIVRFRSDSNARSDRFAGDVFGEMRQRDPEFGPTLPRNEVPSVLRGGADEIAFERPCQVVSTGLPFAIVPIRDADTLAKLQPDLVQVSALLEGTGARFAILSFPTNKKVGAKSEPACFSIAEKMPLPDQLLVVA